MKKIRRIIVLAFAISALLGVFVGGRVWGADDGSGYISGPGPSGGGGGSGSCANGSEASKFQDDCAGWSWVKYRYVGDTSWGRVETPFFRNTGKDPGPYYYRDTSDAMPAACMRDGGTFWHAGINGYMEDYDKFPKAYLTDPFSGSGTIGFRVIGGNSNYSGSWGYNGVEYGWGHWATVNAGNDGGRIYNTSNRVTSGSMNFNGTHRLWYNFGGSIGWKVVWESVEAAPGEAPEYGSNQRSIREIVAGSGEYGFYPAGSSILSDYKDTYYYSTKFNRRWNADFIPTGFWGFCWWPGIGVDSSKINKLRGKVKLEAYDSSNSNRIVSTTTGWDSTSSSSTLKLPYASTGFTTRETVTGGRTGDGDDGKTYAMDFKTKNTYYFKRSVNDSSFETQGDDGWWYNGAMELNANVTETNSFLNKNAVNMTRGYTIDAGKTKKVCERVQHTGYTTSRHPGDQNNSAWNPETIGGQQEWSQRGDGKATACVTVERESKNQTKTTTSIKAYEVSNTSNKSEKASGDDGQQTATDLTINSPNYKIDVTHVAKRSLPSGGGNTNWAINNLSLTYSGGLSGNPDVSWAANNTSDKTIMNKTYSGTLAPGESKTLCFSVSHKINIYSLSITAAHGDGKSQVCITIKRKEAVNKVGVNLQLKTTYTDVNGSSQTSSKDSGWDSDKTNNVASETASEAKTTARTFTVEVTTGSKAKRTGSPIDWALSAPMTYQYSLNGGSTWSTLAGSNSNPMETYLSSPKTWSANNNNDLNLGNRSVSSTALGINNLLPGNSVNFCVRVTHKVTYKYKHVTSGDPVTSSDDGKAQVCQKVTRINRKATYSGSVTATASDSDTSVTSTTDNPGSSQTITVSGNDYKIKYKHVIERTDSAGFSKIDDGTDPLKDLANSWNTTINPTSKPYDANALGEAKSDSVKTPSKKTYTVREYEYSGKIYAGQKITYCETLKYESAINESGTVDGTATKKACIIVKKNAATCSTTLKGADFEGYTYTYNNGKNLGQIGVKNATLGNNYTYTGLTNAAVSIWARPGDDIRFEYNHCAAGLYPYVVHNGTTGTTYTPSGSSDGAATTTLSNNYLFGEQMSTWDGAKSVVKPQNYNVTIDNLLSTTLYGTKYSPGDNNYYNDCLVASGGGPVKGYYKVTGSGVATSCDNRTKTLDVGHTFQQKYVWTNLGYDNGTRFNSGTLSAQASVSVPYNYVLNPYIKNPNTTASLGGTITMNPGVVVAARKNTVISKASAQTYATITKPTSIKVTYFYTDPTGANQKGSGGTLLDSSNVRLNNDGDLNGTGTTERLGKTVENGGATLSSSNNFVIPVDDNTVDVGDRVCMRLVVSPADSVDNPGLASVTDSQIGVAMQETGSSSNTRTIVSCSTVAKRPTMSVESSNAYSATKYETSNYVKLLNGGNYRFGSWSEYGVFGNVNATSPNSPIFASGAALGYSTAGYKTTGGSWTQEANIARNNNSSTEVATKENSSVCTYMTQTFANDDCKSATSKIGSISAEQFRNRMTERYGSGSTNVSVPSGQTIDLSGYSNPNVIDESGAIVMRVNGNAKVSSLPNIPNSAFEARGITSRNRTIVYSMKGKTLTITGNLNEQTGNMTSLDDVTGVVIVAGTVNIDSSVTYINATIIADEVNTCKTHNGKTVMFNGATNNNQVSLSSSICNTTLRFDGPVVTKKIILNRTAGAGKAANSIKRGEIFNLNMADYLWSFNQMSRYNQAVTTYSRELPPRY